MTADEARARWTALDAFYHAQGHFLVTNGPYRLKAWSAEAVTLEAFRDLTYPLGVGSFDALPIPRRYVVIGPAGDVVLAGTAGLAPDATFRLALKDQLPPGAYTLLASVVLNDNAVNAEITRIPYNVAAE